MARIMDLSADGELAQDLVRAKLAELDAERRRLRAELEQARVAVPEEGAIQEAIRTALADVADLVRGDPEGAREALASAEGYRLEGAIEVRTGALDGERRYGQVAGAGFEPATCGL